MSAVTVVEAGSQSLIQDLGRPGRAHLGISRSGAVDRAALRLGNRLVGNGEGAAGIEVTVGGLAVRFADDTWFAVTGAWGPVRLDGTEVLQDAAVLAPAGSVLSFGTAVHGLRFYLCLRGGVTVPETLGSRSRDTLAGLGPEPLAAGDEIPVGSAPDRPVPASDALTMWAPTDGPVDVGVQAGPRLDWFSAEAIARFFDDEWTVSPATNRVGARLDGSPLARARAGELASEGMVAGSVQVPPSGLPTVLLADHPVTGGYPVIAVVGDAWLDRFGQLRPGQRLRFHHAR